MKSLWTRTAALSMLVFSVTSMGCATHEGTGALVGGGLGAGVGSLIGSATGHTGAGALIGGGLGALGGSMVGRAEDRAERREAIRQAQASGPMTTYDVVNMSNQGVSEENIISQIRNTRSRFNLTTEDVISLKQQNVSARVIACMQDTQRQPPPRYVYTEPRAVIIEPYPPPPPVGLGFSYTHIHR